MTASTEPSSTRPSRKTLCEPHLRTDAGRLADALENLRCRLNLTPFYAYGAEGDEDFQLIVQAIDRYSEVFDDEACSNAVKWCLNYHGMLDW